MCWIKKEIENLILNIEKIKMMKMSLRAEGEAI